MEKNYEKKGQIQENIGAIIYLIVGVGVAVMILIFVGLLGGKTYSIVEPDLEIIGIATSNLNAFTASNTSAVSLGHTFIQPGTLTITNFSNTITLDNFTIDYPAGTALLNITAGGNQFSDVGLNASYQWQNTTIMDSIKNSVISGFSALESTGTFLPIIVLAIVITIILGLILGLTALNTGGMGGGRGSAL